MESKNFYPYRTVHDAAAVDVISDDHTGVANPIGVRFLRAFNIDGCELEVQLRSVRCGSYASERQNTGQYSQHGFASFHKLSPLSVSLVSFPWIHLSLGTAASSNIEDLS